LNLVAELAPGTLGTLQKRFLNFRPKSGRIRNLWRLRQHAYPTMKYLWDNRSTDDR